MKKKLAAMILTLALAAGVMAPVPAYADGITVEETSMDTATEKSFDTDYTVKWDADKVYWNKVTLDQQGILRIHLNEEDPKSLENYVVAVYTAKGEKIWKIMMDCAGAAADNYVGLAKGTYYVSLKSHYQFRPSTTYRFSFEKNNTCELEPNEKKNNATGMKVNTMYTGFMGNSYGGAEEDNDMYAVTLKKGQSYKFICDADSYSEKTTIVKLLGKTTELSSFWPSVKKKDFCVASGDVFIAPYTGTYYAYVRNYYGKQYKYEIGVKKINMKAPTVSVSAGKSSAKVSWSKVNNYRYEVEYATNSKFQGAKKVSVYDQKTSVTIKYLTSKKKYYVRVRSCAKTENDNNKKAYSAWSKVKTVTVK
jgi:hypothetical protein